MGNRKVVLKKKKKNRKKLYFVRPLVFVVFFGCFCRLGVVFGKKRMAKQHLPKRADQQQRSTTESRRRTSDHRSKQVRDFLQSYRSVLLNNRILSSSSSSVDNCDENSLGNDQNALFTAINIVDVRDLINKMFEDEMAPFCWLTMTSSTSYRSSTEKMSARTTKEASSTAVVHFAPRFALLSSRETGNDTGGKSTQSTTLQDRWKSENEKQERELASIFGHFGSRYNHSAQLYFLLRSGVLFSYSLTEFMDHWFQVQKCAMFKQLDHQFNAQYRLLEQHRSELWVGCTHNYCL